MTEPSQRLAACSCGRLTARVIGDPVRVSICHCLACQRRTGSVFGQQVFYEPEGLEEFLAIPVGAFADPGFPAPGVSVYEERMHARVVPPPDAEHIF